MSAWQPIETAPRDTWVLVYGAPAWTGTNHTIAVAKLGSDDRSYWTKVDDDTQKLIREVVDYWHGDGVNFDPSHWQPLPDPPA